MGNVGLALGVAAGAIALDQATKSAARGHDEGVEYAGAGPIAFKHMENPGMAWGIGQDIAPYVRVAALAGGAGAAVAAYRFGKGSPLAAVASGLIASGLVNPIEQLTRGSVTDMIGVPGGGFVCNTADIATDVGLGLAMLAAFR